MTGRAATGRRDLAVADIPVAARLGRRLAAEGTASFLLFAAVIGSGIMAENLSGGSAVLALIANMIATAAMLFVLITMFGPISGAHMNPAVTLVARLRGELARRDAAAYILTQIAFGVLGAWTAHLMFELPTLQISVKPRAGLGQWISEAVATFGLILTILGTIHSRPAWVPATVAVYVASAYWFTASTSFANPAITLARSLSDTFAGIAPAHVPLFIAAQLTGACLAAFLAKALFEGSRPLCNPEGCEATIAERPQRAEKPA